MKNNTQNILKSAAGDGTLSGHLDRDFASKKFSDLLIKFSFSLVFVILMWISANSFFYLPFTPIPVTMQVLTVIISALTLGGYWAALAMIEYVFLGLIGAPVFAGFKNGLTAITGPTGGFIIGFIAAAFGAGLLYSSMIKNHVQKQIGGNGNRYLPYILLSSLAGVLIIYSSGYFHFAGYLYLYAELSGTDSLFILALRLAVIPFVVFDLIKVFIILLIYRVFLHEKN